MHDALRRALTVVVVVVFSAGAFFSVRTEHGGYGLADFLLGRQVAEVLRAAGAGSYTTPDGAPVASGEAEFMTKASEEFANLMDRVRPSVVSITTKTVAVRRVGVDPLGLYRYYEEPGLGSGVIVTAEGHLVTNYHVVEDVDDIEVTTSSGEKYEAELVGVERGRDVAVLRLLATGGREFPALPFGDSDEVRVGETVVAVGNPFGLGETVTRGIISALPRPVSDSAFPMFQTDTVINPGNSGGPLINVRGEIIGINVAIYTGQEGLVTWQGVSLAIPANGVRKTFDAIMRTGKSLSGYLGVRVAEIDPREKMRLGIRDGRGVLITDVLPGSPAEVSGLQAGDIVLRFGDSAMHTAQGFLEAIGPKPVGEPVELVILRDEEAGTLEAVIGNRADYVAADPTTGDVAEAAEKISQVLGIAVADLTPYQRYRLGLRADTPGILVRDVFQESPLDVNLEPYDLIYRLNSEDIYSTVQFYEAIDRLPFGEKSVLHCARGRQTFRFLFTPRRGGR